MSSALSARVPRFKNSVVFPGAWTRLTPAAVGPCATSTPPDTVEPQTRPSIRQTLTEFLNRGRPSHC
jgi:hypothetical protein